MKRIVALAMLCLSPTLVGCGDAGSSDDPESSEAIRTATLTRPVIPPPSGPPPRMLKIQDVKEGVGPKTEPGDELSVHYAAVDWTGKEVYSSWTFRDGEALDFELGAGDYFRGWEEGLEGMSAGGRRELQIPKHLSQDELKPLFYVVDLLEIKRR